MNSRSSRRATADCGGSSSHSDQGDPVRCARRPVAVRTAETERPFVLVNMAMTADGKIATANRAVSSFSSPHDHEHLLQLRATAQAVMAGARTADSSPINLGPGGTKFRRLRARRGLAEYNLRVIVSGSGTLKPEAEVFQHRFSPIIVITSARVSAAKLKRLRAVADEVKVIGAKRVDFRRALRWLRRNYGVERLVCEGGGDLNNAMFRAGLVDEVHLTLCPLIFGGRNAPTIAEGVGFPTLAVAGQYGLLSTKRHGNELFLVYHRAQRHGST